MYKLNFVALPITLWHNSLKRFQYFKIFGQKQFVKATTFFQIYLDGSIPFRLKAMSSNNRVEFWDKTFSKAS